MGLPHVMRKPVQPVAELYLKSLFHDKVTIQSYLKPPLPSPVPLLFPKQRKFGITPVKFMGTVLGGYAGEIRRWTQNCRRQASLCRRDMCQEELLFQDTHARSLTVFGGSQVNDAEMRDKGMKLELLISLRLVAMELRFVGFW